MKSFFQLFLVVILFSACRFSTGSAPQIEHNGMELPAYGQDEHVIFYSGFTSSYNHETLIPNWVAYELTAEELETVYTSQSSTFSKDLNLKGRQASREDYSRSGWDKGHMAPKADMRWSETSYWESHYFTNVCPQDHDLNAGDWNSLEKLVRNWARKYGRVYIVCGPIIEDGTYGTIGAGHVQIPDAFFKAVLVSNGSGYTSIAFIFPNDGRHRRLKDYACTVDELESRIGRNLFAALDSLNLETVENTADLTLLN